MYFPKWQHRKLGGLIVKSWCGKWRCWTDSKHITVVAEMVLSTDLSIRTFPEELVGKSRFIFSLSCCGIKGQESWSDPWHREKLERKKKTFKCSGAVNLFPATSPSLELKIRCLYWYRSWKITKICMWDFSFQRRRHLCNSFKLCFSLIGFHI